MSCTQTSSVAEIRQSFLDVHGAIWQARQDAVPRRWYEREETLAASWILTLICLLVALSNPHGTLAVVMLMMVILGVLLMCAFDIEGSSWEQKRDQTRDLPFTDPELQTIASLHISSKTPGYKKWVEAAADHPLGLSDLENLIRALDDNQDAEHKRPVLQHQNQIIFHEEGIS